MPRRRGKKYDGDFETSKTLCWNCANACAGCEWSSAEPRPVPGWQVRKRVHGYDVIACPKFVADARNSGMVRI